MTQRESNGGQAKDGDIRGQLGSGICDLEMVMGRSSRKVLPSPSPLSHPPDLPPASRSLQGTLRRCFLPSHPRAASSRMPGVTKQLQERAQDPSIRTILFSETATPTVV